MPAPVFIVGYWRSGTTHLHNVLSRDPQFGHVSPLASGLPWDLLGIVRALEPLLERALPQDRYVDNVAVNPDSPQEDSIPLANMGEPSYYHGLYFPRRFAHHFRRGVYFENCSTKDIERWRRSLVYFLEKVCAHQGGKRLLMKNPVYLGHISKLREIWPDAKFIHIYRNPYVVFASTRHFFTRLFPELALQRYDNVPLDELILESYPRQMQALLDDVGPAPAGTIVHVRFEDFEQAPMREIERIYDTLGLPGIEQAHPRFDAYLKSIRDYRKNVYTIDPKIMQMIDTHWASQVKYWGYAPPQPSSKVGT